MIIDPKGNLFLKGKKPFFKNHLKNKNVIRIWVLKINEYVYSVILSKIVPYLGRY